MDDYPAAAAQFEKSLARCGADASTLINLALCHYRMDHLDAAHSFVSAGLQQDPTNKMGLLLLRQVT